MPLHIGRRIVLMLVDLSLGGVSANTLAVTACRQNFGNPANAAACDETMPLRDPRGQ
jgi:hypothetical protein